jgi:RNA polymerase-binding transcription factor
VSKRRITNHERRNLRAALEARRLELSGQLSGRIRELSRQERTNDRLHSTQCITDRERVAGMLNRFSTALANVEPALRALEGDCYGNCIRCATPIPMKRLQTMPLAAFCERCQVEIQAIRNGASAPDFDGPRAA